MDLQSNNNFPEIFTKNTLCELDCPKSWSFDTSWRDKIDSEIGWQNLSQICGPIRSGNEICDYLVYHGQSAFEKVAIQNQIVRKLASDKIVCSELSRSDVDWQMGNTWERHLDRSELIFQTQNAGKSPLHILEAINFTRDFIHRGWRHSEALISFIENTKIELEAEQLIARQARRQQSSRSIWNQIDVDHSGVKEGFLYVLENALMPGVYKIGFTASNPDKRAKQISEQYALPSPFTVKEYWRTQDPYIVEQRVHEKLQSNRSSGEFFKMEFEHIKLVVHEMLKN